MDKHIFVLIGLVVCETALSLQPNKFVKDQVGHYIKTGNWKHVKTSTHIKNPIYVDVVSKYKLHPLVMVKKKFIDCADILRNKPWKRNQNGVYTIHFKGSYKHVFCDMTKEGGGWTVIQRNDMTLDFDKNWNDYKNGFGSASGAYWIGNEEINFLTTKNNQELRVDLKKKSGSKGFAKYSTFKVDSESNKYRLTVGGYSGNAGDGFKGVNNKDAVLNGMYFGTKDNDNDKRGGNCAKGYKGGWWHNNCFHSLLNTKLQSYHQWGSTEWNITKLKTSQMMIRPKQQK